MSKTFLDKDNNILATVYETHEIVANPVLEGGEEEFTGLQVGNKKYAAPQGTPVVANPVLTGDEQALEGLEVEGTKYKVSGGLGKIYNHNITISRTDYNGQVQCEVNLTIPLTKQDKLTRTEFKQYLASSNSGISATGFYSDGRDITSAKRFIINSIAKIGNKYDVMGASESVSASGKPTYYSNFQDITSYLKDSNTGTVYVDSVIEA